jgi:hypothetical protein
MVMRCECSATRNDVVSRLAAGCLVIAVQQRQAAVATKDCAHGGRLARWLPDCRGTDHDSTISTAAAKKSTQLAVEWPIDMSLYVVMIDKPAAQHCLLSIA